MIPFVDAGALVLLLHPLSPDAYPCERDSGSLRSLCAEWQAWHPPQARGVLYAHTIKRHNFGKYYFVANAKPLQLVVNLPDTSKNKLQDNVMIFRTRGYARDLML